MPTPHSEEGLERLDGVERRRKIALGLLVLGGALVAAPTAFWPPATASEATLQVDEVELGAVSEPTPFDELSAGVQGSFDDARSGEASTAVEDRQLLHEIRQHPYVAHEGTTYRLAVYYGEQSTLGVTLFGPLLVAFGVALGVVGWLSERRNSLRPLTPVRGMLVPGGTLVALWLSPTTGGLVALPPALGLLVPLGTILVPVGTLCRQRGKEYLVAGPAIGLAVAVLASLALGANPARLDVVVTVLAMVALPWFALGAVLCERDAAGW